MRIQALALVDSDTHDWLAACLGDQAALVTADADELQHQLDREAAHSPRYRLVFVQMPGSGESREVLIRKLAGRHPELTIVAVAAQAESGEVLVAIRAGAADFLIRGQDDGRIGELLAATMKRGLARSHQGCEVIAILAGHADSGLALLGQHLALCAAQSPNENVLLLDLAGPANAAALCMNIQHEYTALDAIADAYRCDATLVDTAFARHRQGPYVLALPESLAEPPAVAADELGRFLDVAATLFSKIIVCADRGLGEMVVHSIAERADHALILCDQSILFSRHNQQMLRGMRSAGIPMEQTGLVVDRYQKRVGLEPEKLAELLQLPLYAVLGGDPANRLKAMNAGESLFETAPSDEYPRGVKRLVQQLLGQQVRITPEKRGGFLEKLLS